eukprot:TRINITY_DN21473_c0_g1_i1.p2 TRINITY_DN21473_c0_g1~~TRINITY_DN21473_c0_g1_i1.p2  ORF type:complete len:213 (+),score=75.93 TRINITY_DN21473_c0_g1_i1:1313-1951(+)
MSKVLTAAALFAESDRELWKGAIAKYAKCLLRKKNAEVLAEDDAYLDTKMSTGIRNNELSVGDLERAMRWKLTRGQWRPKLMDLVRTNKAEDVSERCKAANRYLGDKEVRKALKEYSSLKGIGPATASLLLSLACDYCPFMSDEAYEASMGKKIKRYSEAEYLEYQAVVAAKATELDVSAAYVEKALWAQHMSYLSSEPSSEEPRTKKRKLV